MQRGECFFANRVQSWRSPSGLCLTLLNVQHAAGKVDVFPLQCFDLATAHTTEGTKHTRGVGIEPERLALCYFKESLLFVIRQRQADRLLSFSNFFVFALEPLPPFSMCQQLA